jgi:hypothetical protein
VKKRVLGGKTPVNRASTACCESYGRGMRINDDIWLPERDAWGADRLAWEDEQDDSQGEPDEPEAVPEDPRY